MNKKEVGNYCEQICSNYLINLGYNIIETNYYSRYGEIDIIAKNNEYLIFVEAKARILNSVIKAYEAVNKKKMEKIIKTAYVFLSCNEYKLQPRFDICEIYFLKNKIDNNIKIEKINYIKNSFDLNCLNLDTRL